MLAHGLYRIERGLKMSNLVAFARKELELAGWFDQDGFYEDEIGRSVIELIKVFADQRHSGMSAGICTSLFEKLARFEPLTPLTGEDDEWNDITNHYFVAKVLSKGEPDSPEPDEIVDLVNRYTGPVAKKYQNRRCSRVFKDETGTYDSQGKLFRLKDGGLVQRRESRVYITFPYTPKTEIVDIED